MHRIQQQVLQTKITERSEPWALLMALTPFELFTLATARLRALTSHRTQHFPLAIGPSQSHGSCRVTAAAKRYFILRIYRQHLRGRR